MRATEREKSIYGKDVEILFRDDDCAVYRIADETGNVVMTSYHVFPGIDLIYNDVNASKCTIHTTGIGNIVEINHCREGRIECEFKNEFFYLSKGDLAISRKDHSEHSSYFPVSRYYGITIMIDANHAPRCLSCILEDVNVQPSVLIQKFCSDSEHFVVRSKPCLEHIFSELYYVPDSIKKGYFKIKILELLLFLSGMEVEDDQFASRCYSKTQVTLAKSVCKYLMEHMDSRITIQQLAEEFHVSQTQLKNIFRGVYGVSVYSYIRRQKMQAAAVLLKQSDDTILKIAGKYGYDNGSKFAKAFKDTFGMTPNEYRKAESS